MLIISTDTLTRQLAEHNVMQIMAADDYRMREVRFENMVQELKAQAVATTELAAMLAPIKWFLKIMGGLVRVIKFILSGFSSSVKWAGAIAAACLALYSLFFAATHDGTFPTLPKIK